MPPRQVWLFQFGSWSAIATAIVFLVVAMTTGTDDGSMVGLLFTVCFASLGSTGLVVTKRGQADALLMYGMARSAAVAAVALLVLSLSYFWIVPSLPVAAVTTCFAVSAVKAPGI